MKTIHGGISCILLLLVTANTAVAQINVPAKFYLIKGESPAGRDDYYTDGKYCLGMSTPWQADHPRADTACQSMLKFEYGLPFRETSDGLFIASGFSRGDYRYIVVTSRFSYVLFSKVNDKGFSDYSIWLLETIRQSIKMKRQEYLN